MLSIVDFAGDNLTDAPPPANGKVGILVVLLVGNILSEGDVKAATPTTTTDANIVITSTTLTLIFLLLVSTFIVICNFLKPKLSKQQQIPDIMKALVQ